jgi:hypothetical protein
MTVFSGVGSPGSVNATNGGKVYAINTLGTSPSTVIAANPSRLGITFHNPGTNTAYVAPTLTATGAALTPSLAALGGTFQIFPGGLLIISGECQGAWQAFVASGSNQPLTVMETNV